MIDGAAGFELGRSASLQPSQDSSAVEPAKSADTALLAAMRVLLVLAACAVFVAADGAGLWRGLDTYIAPFAAGPFLHATCVVATKWLTGLGNYVCLRDISDVMSPIHGIMYDLGLREDGVSWNYLLDRQFVDHALQQLFAHPHWTVPRTTSGPPYQGIQGIGWGMDEGHADFVNLAYSVFGPSIEALYQGYWLVFGVSAAAFIWAYRQSLAPLVLALVVAIVQYMIFSTPFLWFTDAANHPTTEPGNPRFLSCLCVVPMLHFMAAARSERPLRWRDALPLLVQSLVLGLAMLQRTTVLWVVVAAFLWAGFLWLLRRRFSIPIPTRNYYPIAALVIAVGALTHLYLRESAHPGIAANGFTSGHNVWFGMFYELQTHPDWKRRYAAQYDNKVGDFLPDYAWRRYLANHHEEWPRWNPQGEDPFHHGITQAGVEDLCRKAFFEFARHDPIFVMQVWLIYNPRALEAYTSIFLGQYLSWLVPFPFLVLIAIGIICGLLTPRSVAYELIFYVPATAFLCLMAVLPNVASLVIPESLSDYFDLLAIFIAMIPVAVGVGLGLGAVSRLSRSATASNST